MSLPAITIPVEIPFHVPLLLHPVVVHFAIAIPIIVLILELFNLYFKRRALNVISVSFLLVVIIIFAGLFVTGTTDGSEAGPLLSKEGLSELKEHKLLGIYLVYASLLPIIFKALSLLVKNKWVKMIYLVVLLTFIGVSLKQGKDGGELVYKYGANIAAVAESQGKIEDLQFDLEDLQESAKDNEEEIASLQEELDGLKGMSDSGASAVEAVQESAKAAVETDVPAASEANEVVEKAKKVTDEATGSVTKEVDETVEEHAPAAH